jgi:hypothetical protein
MINALIIELDDQGVHLEKRGGAEGTRTPDPHTASNVTISTHCFTEAAHVPSAAQANSAV